MTNTLTTANLPAFPKPQETNWASMGLTKMELIAAMIYAHDVDHVSPDYAVKCARELIKEFDMDKNRREKKGE